MKSSASGLAAALLLASCATPSAPPSGPPVFPQDLKVKATGTPGQAAGTRYVRIGAKVTSVDPGAHTITVETGDGQRETIPVASEVTNLEAFAAGDVLHITYEQGLQLDYQSQDASTVSLEIASAASAPGGASTALVRATVVITSIDLPARTVQFTGPRGNLYRVSAGPKVPLERLKVGDHLLATYTESFAVTLEKAGPSM
jgi:hypothetical protein